MKINSMKMALTLACVCMLPSILSSQIPTRIIVNSGFESPVMGCASPSYSFYPQSSIPGWKTLDSVPAATVNCDISGANQPYLIELWSNGFNSRASHSGNQFAEINASAATFLYQEICVIANESVPFSVWHLRRASSGTGEQMAAELKTLTNSNIATAATHIATSSWTNYTGSLTNNGTTGMRKYGFRAISGGSLGNLVDDVTISLKPLVDIKAFSFSSVYETDSNYLYLYLNGTLLGPATVTLTKSGVATYGSDYNIGTPNRGTVSINGSGTITLTLPAGDYNPNLSTGTTRGLIKIPFYVINDLAYEPNETLIYTVSGAANGGNGNASLDLVTGINGQSAVCSTAVSTSQFTIVDISALPVKLVSFSAQKDMDFNTIKWEVAEEENISKYILEYSPNGNVFATVDEIPYSAASYNNYTSTHRAPANDDAYYRLSTMDMNGNITVLSDVIMVEKSNNINFSIFPNPNSGALTLNFYSGKETSIEFSIYDLYGKKISSTWVNAQKGENNVPVELNNELPSGMYFISYLSGNTKKTVRMNVLR